MRVKITCHRDWYGLVVIMKIMMLTIMLMMMVKMMIMDNCIHLQNLQACLDLTFVVEEVVFMVEDHKVLMSSNLLMWTDNNSAVMEPYGNWLTLEIKRQVR